MLSNGGRKRVHNLGRRTGLWTRNCSPELCCMTSISEQELSGQTIGMNQRTFGSLSGSFPEQSSHQGFPFLFAISRLLNPSPLEWSCDNEESTTAAQLPWARPGNPVLGFTPGSSASVLHEALSGSLVPSASAGSVLASGRLE